MIGRMVRITPACITAAMWVLGSGAVAMAQLPKEPGPPPTNNSLIPYAFGVVLLAGVGVAAFKNSKRTHQD